VNYDASLTTNIGTAGQLIADSNNPPKETKSKVSIGVGDLPGGEDESGVVVLPAERNTLPTSFDERLGAQPGDRSDGVGSLPGKSNESGVALLPDERNDSFEASGIKRAPEVDEKGVGVGSLHDNKSAGIASQPGEPVGKDESDKNANVCDEEHDSAKVKANTVGAGTAAGPVKLKTTVSLQR
jgi:hypothetical protein